MIGPVFLELDPAEKVDVGDVGAQVGKRERDLCLRDGLILLGIVDETFLDEIAQSPAPARPQAKPEKTDRKRWGRDGADDADKGLLTADFGPDILAENGALQVGKDGILCHGSLPLC